MPQRAEALADWLIRQGLEGATQSELLNGYCEALVGQGIGLKRVHVAQSAFHPRYGGIGFEWTRDGDLSSERYEHRDAPLDQWMQSPLYHLLESGETTLRERLTGPPSRFPMLNDLRAMGGTDYFAAAVSLSRIDPSLPIDPNDTPEGVLVSWTSDSPGGFSDDVLGEIKKTLPHLALALKSAANRQMAQDLLGVYLGADAGNRVLSGEIERGSLQEIDAVICNFDLAGFTVMAEQIAGPDVIAMLNDYFAVAVDVIERNGGNILKFMGDGILAIFDLGEIAEDARAALRAAAELRMEMANRNRVRAELGLPVAGFTLAMHAGEILYGNIGAEGRLDFTVIGPAVNQTARVAGMHKSLGQDIILSDEVARAAAPCPHDLVSLGRYMLRGVSEPMELFTVFEAGPA